MKRISKVLSISKSPENQSLEVNINGIIGIPAEWQGDETALVTKEEMRAEIAALKNAGKKVKKIIINIDSPGGSVDHAISIYNEIVRMKAPVHVNYTGISASAATIIAASAPVENISIPTYVNLLVHEARLGVFLEDITITKAENWIKDLNVFNQSIARIYTACKYRCVSAAQL